MLGRKTGGAGGACLRAGDKDVPRLEPCDGAALFYTADTRGAAKGVPLSHANLAFQIDGPLVAESSPRKIVSSCRCCYTMSTPS